MRDALLVAGGKGPAGISVGKNAAEEVLGEIGCDLRCAVIGETGEQGLVVGVEQADP